MAFISSRGSIVRSTNSVPFITGSGSIFPFLNDGYDATQPTLSSASIGTVNETDADYNVTTDKATGTLYIVYSLVNIKPNAAQVKAGQNNSGVSTPNNSQSITSIGAKIVNVSGLTGDVTYYAFAMHESIFGVQSLVIDSVSFTTDPPVTDVTSVNGGSTIVENVLATIVGDTFESTQGTGIVELISGSYADQLTVTTWADTQITATASKPSTGAVPYTDVNHSVSLRVTSTSHNSGTLAVTYNPPSGYTAYPLSAADVNVTVGESVLALAGVDDNDQVVFPAVNSNGKTITVETSNDNATGRFTIADDAEGNFTISFWDATDGSVKTSIIYTSAGSFDVSTAVRFSINGLIRMMGIF